MAITEIIEVTDDLDGSPDAEGVTFSLNGVDYAIDLAAVNRRGLEDALAPFIAAATRIDRTPRLKAKRKKHRMQQGDPAAIRAWAAEQGIQVADRGRIPTEVKLAYLESA
jgi:hypothetical protein